MQNSIFPGSGRYLAAFALWAAILAGIAPLRAGDEPSSSLTPGPVDPAWSSTLLGFGVKANDAYTDGNLFLTVPLRSTIGANGMLRGDYIFLEPYSSVGSYGELASSLGLSWRHLFSNEPVSALHKTGQAGFMEEGWFLGGNVFGDMLDSVHRNQFYQMGFGAEIGSRYLEFRGNYYLRLTGEKLYDHETQNFTSTRTVDSTVQGNYSDPYATGNSILQSYNTTTYATTATSTASTVTDLYERGMQGWDAETAVLVPWVDQWLDAKILGGYLDLDGQPVSPDRGSGPMRGWKAGVEVRPVPAVVLTGMWYEDKDFVGSSWIAGVEFQIPLDKDWRDAFKFRRRHLVERLAEPVHRQNDAIQMGNHETQTSSATPSKYVTNLLTQTATTVVIKNDLVFVNNGGAVGNGIQAGSASGTGVAEHPVNTIQSGANIAGANSTSSGNVWTAYVQGGGPTYNETVTTTGSANYFASSQPIPALGGKVFGGTGPNPVVNGAIIADASANPAIRAFGVTGFTILNGDQDEDSSYTPIYALDVPSVTITNNTVNGSINQDGIYVESSNGALSTVAITGNVVTNSSQGGIQLFTAGAGSSINAIVSNNTVSNSSGGDGISSFAESGATVNATIAGNSISNTTDGYGVSFYTYVNGTAQTIVLSGNTTSGSGADDVYSDTEEASSLTLTATNNVFSGAGGNGFNLNGFNTSVTTVNASGNLITSPTGNGFLLASNNASTINANLTGNTVVGSGASGISAQPGDASGIVLVINQNIISNSATFGIQLQPTSPATISLNAGTALINNTISGSGTSSLSGSATGNSGSVEINGVTYTLPINAP